jgi:hypothetical protein
MTLSSAGSALRIQSPVAAKLLYTSSLLICQSTSAPIVDATEAR